jgi:hypothetical protein
MKKYQVEFKDYGNGAISPIDTIEVEEGYTPVDYLKDYKSNCLGGEENLYDNGEISFTEITED